MAQALLPKEITACSIKGQLLSPLSAVQALETVELASAELAQVANGVAIFRPCHGFRTEVAATWKGELAAILRPRGSDKLGPTCNFAVEMNASTGG